MKIGILVLTFICFFFVSCDDAPLERDVAVKKASETVDWQKIGEIVKNLTETGLIKKLDLGARSVWVDTTGWTLIDAEMKETLTRTIAYHCAHKAGDQTYFADVYDWQSGKKVAKYDALGFKVY